MKNKSFQTIAVLLAFLIGVAINNSCGDSIQSANDMSITYLSNQVKAMQTEIEQLKTETNQLKQEISQFQVNGLWFYRNGAVASKPKEWSSKSSDIFNTCVTGTYKYDEYGRMIESTDITYKEGRFTDPVTTTTNTYQYNENTVTIISATNDVTNRIDTYIYD